MTSKPVFHWGLRQRTEAWERIRIGKVTASRFGDIVTPKTGEYSKSAERYINELIFQSLNTGEPPAFAGNFWTDRGTELEPIARKAFTERTGIELVECGFVEWDTNGTRVIGCSPDGLAMDDDGFNVVTGAEIKCPSGPVMVGHVREGTLPDEYKAQVHGSMIITGTTEWRFWEYHPDMEPFHLLVERDAYTDKVEAALVKFIAQYAKALKETMPRIRKAA